MENLTKNTRIIILYERQKHKCAYCKKLLYEDDKILKSFNIDHDLPISRGGKDTIDNLVLSCIMCNSAKANLTGDEFRVAIEKLQMGKITQKDLSNYAKYMVLKRKFKD